MEHLQRAGYRQFDLFTSFYFVMVTFSTVGKTDAEEMIGGFRVWRLVPRLVVVSNVCGDFNRGGLCCFAIKGKSTFIFFVSCLSLPVDRYKPPSFRSKA